MTGQTEKFTAQQLAEQDTFLRETMSNTELGRELFAFLYTKGTEHPAGVDVWLRTLSKQSETNDLVEGKCMDVFLKDNIYSVRSFCLSIVYVGM